MTKHGKKEFSALMSSHKARKVMGEYGKGDLKSSSGQRVTDVSQARAIAISESERARKK